MGTLTVKCKLHNGQVRKYHAASLPNSRPYDKRFFHHIGDGVIYSIGGIQQYGTEILSFFKLKGDK